MEDRSIKIKSNKNSKISIKIIPGHFATNHSHINYYIDMTTLKYRSSRAHEAAVELAHRYATTTEVDTIVCMDGCEIIGAFLAQELFQSSNLSMNESKEIAVITPEYNSNSQMIFRDNIQTMIWGKNVLLLLASTTTGKTITRSLECIKYYGGNTVGIAAIFSAIEKIGDIEIHSLFVPSDLPDYRTYKFGECPDCQAKKKIDAIVNSFGYSKI